MNLPIYQLQAFASERFKGNPAAVVWLETRLTADMMQNIARENGLPATAFVRPYSDRTDRFDIRWFTPKTELPLCAHASLAAASVIFDHRQPDLQHFVFEAPSVTVKASRADSGYISLRLPIEPYEETDLDSQISDALGASPERLLRSKYSVAVFKAEEDVRALRPDIAKVKQSTHGKRGGLIVATAPADAGRHYDFVSRFFAPAVGLDEDPVTGSAHCILSKVWADTLQKDTLIGFQCSERTGTVRCEVRGAEVELSGQTRLYSKGTIYL